LAQYDRFPKEHFKTREYLPELDEGKMADHNIARIGEQSASPANEQVLRDSEQKMHEERRMRDALEDDEVREALKRLHNAQNSGR
jgi:hypothetical protein